MNQILQTYNITDRTLAILPAHHIDYESVVLEIDGEYHIKKKPKEIIDQGCLVRGSSYDGRREAVIHLTGSKHKVPIPIDPYEPIYAFPTHSPQQFNCMWLFYLHITSISASPKSKETVIHFSNHRSITIPVSYYTIQKQLQRTSYCMTRFFSFVFRKGYKHWGGDEGALG